MISKQKRKPRAKKVETVYKTDPIQVQPKTMEPVEPVIQSVEKTIATEPVPIADKPVKTKRAPSAYK